MQVFEVPAYVFDALCSSMSVKPFVAKINVGNEQVAGVEDQGVVVVHGEPGRITQLVELVGINYWLFTRLILLEPDWFDFSSFGQGQGPSIFFLSSSSTINVNGNTTLYQFDFSGSSGTFNANGVAQFLGDGRSAATIDLASTTYFIGNIQFLGQADCIVRSSGHLIVSSVDHPILAGAGRLINHGWVSISGDGTTTTTIDMAVENYGTFNHGPSL